MNFIEEQEMNDRRNTKTDVFFWLLFLGVLAIVSLSGCQTGKYPRLRVGEFFGSPVKMRFPDPNHLGRHHYDDPEGERIGMVYTCGGGFIDIGHLREAADRTAYLASVTNRNLLLDQTVFRFQVIEPSRYWVTISYPENWDDLSTEERSKIAGEVSILLGQYFARTSLIWHEILTWYGFSSTGLFSENISAFSWEDPYSDLLGTCLAVWALRDDGQTYDDAMTELIDRTLRELDVQPSEVAQQAAQQIKGRWFSGGYYFFVDMKIRNYDVGLDDGRITPRLVPGICPDAEPQPCLAPSLDILTEYGFKMELEIEPRVMEKTPIYHDLQLKNPDDRIRPADHFPEIMRCIKRHANTSGENEKESFSIRR